MGNFKQWLLESPIPEYNIFGENMIITDDWDHYADITKQGVLGAGTHAQISYYLGGREKNWGEKHHPEGKGWHRSKEKVAGSPYAGYLTNKKWHMNEVKIKDTFLPKRTKYFVSLFN